MKVIINFARGLLYTSAMKYLFYGFLLILFVTALRVIIPQATIEPEPIIIEKAELTTIVNEWAMKEKGYTYKELPELCDVAALRLNQIQRDFSHKGFEESYLQFYKIIKAYRMGENLSKNIMNEEMVLEAWLNSPLHREVLDDSYTHMCIETDGNYVVQLFAIL